MYGVRLSSSILTCTASTTTIALSTTIPIANTKAKSVIKLIDSPNNCITKKDPINETGTAIIGINVERQSPKNKKTTIPTRINASLSVCKTCSTEASRTLETS